MNISSQPKDCGLCWIRVAAVCGFLSVALGAFGAHGLESIIPETDSPNLATRAKRIENFHTAAEYQIYHSLAILAAGIAALARPSWGRSRAFPIACWSFLLGILIFSGSLYIYALTGLKWLGAITPLGGVAFLVGWIALVLVRSGDDLANDCSVDVR